MHFVQLFKYILYTCRDLTRAFRVFAAGTLSLLFYAMSLHEFPAKPQGKDKDLQKMLHRAGVPGYANATLANTGATYLTLGDFSILDASTRKRQEKNNGLGVPDGG